MRVDRLGRIVIPKRIRDSLGITENTKLDIELDHSKIIITTVKEKCVLCETALLVKSDIPLCENCVEKIKKI